MCGWAFILEKSCYKYTTCARTHLAADTIDVRARRVIFFPVPESRESVEMESGETTRTTETQLVDSG
jgi:hypothetical protein